MRKPYVIIAVVLIVFLSALYLSGNGIQTVSTDKSSYSPGEPVIIKWSDYGLMACTCRSTEIGIYRQGPEGWVQVKYRLLGFGKTICLDGKAYMLPMPCDVVSCNFPQPYSKSGDFTWNTKMYGYGGQVESCMHPFNNETINKTMGSYSYLDAPSGSYKIVFGLAEAIIEIR